MRNCTEQILGLQRHSLPEGTSHEPTEEAISAWRVHLRLSGYISHPEVINEIHTSMKGVELDPELLDIVANATNRRQHHMRLLFPSNRPMPKAPLPTFVTAEERDNFHKVENKNMETIKEMVSDLLDELDSDESRQHYRAQWKKVKNKNKVELVKFYYVLREEVDDQIPLALLQ